MNDDIREKLSAYLDGALSDEERRSVELEVSRSEELRLELESLRAVSAAVKGLPKAKLPAGFLARLESRRAREGTSPAREYFILPPAYRPLAFALSTAVVALVIWDKTVTRPDAVAPHVGWDGDRVAVKSAADAPPSIDVSAQLSALDGRRKGSDDELTAQTAKKEDAGQFKGGGASTFGKNVSAPGKPLEVAEADGIAASGGAGGSVGPSPTASGRGTSSPYGSVAGMISGAAGLSAPASAPAPAAAARRAAPAGAQGEPAEGKANAFSARNEEERSAINEQLYQGFEEEKKRMGIAKIMDKDAEEEDLPSGGREFMALQASPESPRLDRSRSVAAVRGAASSKAKAGAPAFRAIALKTHEALAAAWAAAGLPGEPPAVNFPEQMALFLAGPSGSGIVDVRERKNTLLVLYKGEGFDDPSARVRAVALSPKPVVVKLAP